MLLSNFLGSGELRVGELPTLLTLEGVLALEDLVKKKGSQTEKRTISRNSTAAYFYGGELLKGLVEVGSAVLVFAGAVTWADGAMLLSRLFGV